jgi:hypothetical protein
VTSAPVRDPLSDHLLTPDAEIIEIVLTDRLLKEQEQ